MKKKPYRRAKRSPAKSILRLPDLEISKAAVINSLSCPGAQRGYRHAIDEFVDWYCSEPRLSFSKTVVVRYPNAPAITAARARNNQPPPRCCAPPCIRSGRLRTSQRGFGSGNPAGQRRQEVWCEARQLVNSRAGKRTLAGTRSCT